jgi:prolipoprotein diacylglyceryltransferase
MIWDFIGGPADWVGRRFTIRPPAFALYVAWYCFGRFFEELPRRPGATLPACGSTPGSK